jgi:hypothetical protein
MRNDVVGRSEPLDDLKPARLLHEHALALTVGVADSDHEAVRHPPNELALVERDRDKLLTGRIRAFAKEVHPSTVDPFEPPLIDLMAHGRSQRGLAFPILICSHNCSPPCVHGTSIRRIGATRSNAAARPNMAEASVLHPGYASHLPETMACKDYFGE